MMKNHLLYFLPFAVATLASNQAFGGSHTNSCAGSDFHEKLQQGIVLTATTNAPAGASGMAHIIAVNDNGTNLAVLFVKTTGLTNGAYTVALTDVSGSNIYNLGTLNVAARTNSCGHGGHGDDGDHGDYDRDHRGHSSCGEPSPDNWANWVHHCATNFCVTNLLCGCNSTNWFGTNVFHWYTNCLTVGRGSFLLPSALAQSNVAGIFISDSDGNVDLTGDFTGVTNSTSIYIQTVGLVPGTATNVQGQATLKITSRNGKSFGTFKLSATGLEARQKLYLTANETNTVKVCTSKSGTLTVRCLPHFNVVNLQTVVATDVSSNVVFSVSFVTE